MLTFQQMKSDIWQQFTRGEWVQPSRWQGIDVSAQHAARMLELINVTSSLELGACEDLDWWRKDIEPYLPWADDHFAERISGFPLNPGNTWDKWRHGKSAAKFLDGLGMFNHTYMQRLWPKFPQGSRTRTPADFAPDWCHPEEHAPMFGVGCSYGDLQDVVSLLVQDPLTRQAFIPLFFPEDTGIGDGGRKPCTLGYQFIMRNDQMHMYYPLRSCDFANHFADDIYLAVRLLLWMLDQCRERDPRWHNVQAGTLTWHATSLHMFVNDYHKMRQEYAQ